MEAIKFYRVTEKPYGCFSNFYKSPMVIDGETWPTVEHYFQAMKFPNHPEIRDLIRIEPKPIETKHIANKQYGYLVDKKHWEEIKDEVMYKALLAKYTQHEDLKQILLSTGDSEIIEHTANDTYWADGGDGSGKNVLGKLLMKVREEIKCPQKLV